MSHRLHEELIEAIVEWNPMLAGAIGRSTPLLTTSRLDSLALVRLVTWIEERIGKPVDVTTVDMGAEWNDVDSIVRFVQRRTGA